jgi:hypothetical protein
MHLTDIQIGAWNVLALRAAFFTGKSFFVDPVNGSDSNDGTKETPYQTLYKAYNQCTSGRNDVVYLIANGTSAGAARLSLASAAANTPSGGATPTSGILTWAKNACHLIGLAPPFQATCRARIAPVSTDTQALFGSANFVVVTGSGCWFENLEAYNGFATGGANQICWTDYGRNTYYNCILEGMGDAASAASTGSRSLLCTGNVGESAFVNCTIGLDTIARNVANASVEFANYTVRNRFINCVFPFYSGAAGTPLAFLAAAQHAMDRFQIIENCKFLNAIDSVASQMTALATLAAGSGGGLLFINPTLVGITGFGSDANSRAQIYIDGGPPVAGTTGLAVPPTV